MKQTLKKGLVILGIILSLCVIPMLSNITRDCKSTVSNISNEPEQKYKASVGDVIEQEIYLEESLESMVLYMSLESQKEEVIQNYDEEDDEEDKNVAILKVEIPELSGEGEQKVEFESAKTNSIVTIPVVKNNGKDKWVTLKITVTDLEEGMDLYFYFDSVTDSVKEARINDEQRHQGLSLRYVQKEVISMGTNLFAMCAVLFLIVFFVWYCIKNKEEKLNSLFFFLFLLVEIFVFHFYDNYVFYHGLPSIKKFFYLIAGIMFAVLLGLFILLKKKAKMEWVTSYCVFGFGLLYLLVLPAFSTPDEPFHYVSAYKISNQMLLQPGTDEKGNVFVRVGDYEEFDITPGVETYRKLYGSLFDFSNTEATVVGQKKAIDTGGSAMGHLPGAIGITIARLLKLNKSMLQILGRLMGLLFYCFCIYWAVKTIPFGKMVLFVISMFPMTLEECSSFGYDLVVNGLVFFIIAYIAKLIYEKQKVTTKDIVLVSLVMFLLAPCKVIYIFIAAMWILIPKEKFLSGKKKERRRWTSTLIVFLSAIIPNILINLNQVSRISLGSSLSFDGGERGYSLFELLQNIPYAIYVFINSLNKNWEFYVSTLIGKHLGWIEINISQFIINTFLIILVMEFFRDTKPFVIKKKDRVCYGGIVLVVSLAVMASMWLSWTPVSNDVIQGVQGRYFLPIVPLVYLMVANNKKIEIKSSINLNIVTVCFLNIHAILDVLKTTFCR